MAATVDIRLTSIWEYTRKYATFVGVPIANDAIKSIEGKIIQARSLVFVKTPPEVLPMEPLQGQHWRITGDVEKRQGVHGDFKLTEYHFINPGKCEVTLPHDGEQFIQFIAKEPEFERIGERKARDLWLEFGKEIFTIIEEKDSGRLKHILTPLSTQRLFDGYEKYTNLRYSTWFADHRIPPYIQQRLFKLHKHESVDTIKENPYTLISFGLSFNKTDNLAKAKFDISEKDARRLVAAVEWAIREKSKNMGHTLLHPNDIIGRVTSLFDGGAELANEAMQLAKSKFSFQYNEVTDTYHHTDFLIMEKVVAKRLLSLKEHEAEWSIECDDAMDYAVKDLPYGLTTKQRQSVVNSLAFRVSCITGGAGTGKTTILRTVLRAFDSLGYNIKAVALTGRAAKRLHESTGFNTSTISRLLLEEPIEHDEKCVIVIDEASMVSLVDMYKLVIHTNPSVRFVVVGDYHQLPPIGAGLVLADIVKSKSIVEVELDIVQRQDSSTGIPEYSRQVRDGVIPVELSTGNIHFHDTSFDAVAEVCTQLYCKKPSASLVLSATNAMTDDINDVSQKVLNDESQELVIEMYSQQMHTGIRLGDPVMFTKNNYNVGVQNGSLGTLVSIEKTDDSFGVVRLEDDNSEVKLTKALLDSLVRAYAITLHKAQGSQFKRIIIALSKTSMIDRSWIYTAITRAEVEVHIVGTRQRMHKAVKSLSAHHIRQTHLHHLLAEGNAS